MEHTFITEEEAAKMMGYSCYTFRSKVKSTKMYKESERLPITYTTGGKGYMYSKEDIQTYLAKNAVSHNGSIAS